MLAMNRRKNLLILLLALTLPIQGYAAAVIVFCGAEKITVASAVRVTPQGVAIARDGSKTPCRRGGLKVGGGVSKNKLP